MESFSKTLKAEKVYLWEYAGLATARTRIGHFLEEVYNRRQLHSAFGYRPSAEFEQSLHVPTSAYWLSHNRDSLHRFLLRLTVCSLVGKEARDPACGNT